MATTDNNKSTSARAHGANEKSFEENFTRLQEVVARLSDGNLTLEEALRAYEEGMALADRCAHMLDEAELRVKQVGEKALRAGAASLDELRRSQSEENEAGMQGLVAIEFDAFESTLIFDESPARSDSVRKQEAQEAGKKPQPQPQPQPQSVPLPRPQTPVQPSQATQQQARPRPTAQPLLDELDPLFDEDD